MFNARQIKVGNHAFARHHSRHRHLCLKAGSVGIIHTAPLLLSSGMVRCRDRNGIFCRREASAPRRCEFSSSTARTAEAAAPSTDTGGNEEPQPTGLTITDPLILYRQYVDSGRIRPDEAQHRAAIEFQKLYYRVRDYMPSGDFARQIEKLSELLDEEAEAEPKKKAAWYSPERETLSLIRKLSDEEEVLLVESPQGLMIHGDVGSGKSMLMDLFAASLPHGSKRRWHYHSFMLSVYSRIHRETQRHERLRYLPDSSVKKQRINLQNEYVLLKIAQELVEESAVLLLDEFMLPDIAAAKIVRTLFTYFFKMGGVLVATSNRLPKELYSADFKKSQFGSFYDILQARCISYDMRSQRDWRRILCEESAVGEADKRRIQRYWVAGRDPEAAWEEMLREMTSSAAEGRAEGADKDVEEIKVYGRTVRIPWARDGVAKFTFEELCDSPLAGADYISIASRYHTVILDGVPALRLNKKNQARRMITLLDALYECRVRLVMRAETEADELFFPEMKRDGVSAAEVEVGKNSSGATQQQQEEDSLELEMYSEVDLDLSSPYRPNVSAYDETEKEKTFATAAAPGVAVGRETGEQQTSDYTRASAFTGEDERFAFKRAISRLKEMTGSDAWWEQERWMPVDEAVRTWEGSMSLQNNKSKGGIIEDGSERAGLHGRWEGRETNAFQRYNEEPALRFSVAHFWSMVSWGPGKRRDERTRRWMRGAEEFGGEGEREKERKREEE